MKRPAAALTVLVGAATFLAFLPALDGGFVDWDDDRNFLDNPNYRGLGWRELRWMLTATWMGHYIPLAWASLGLNYALGGMRPWGYHLGNLLLHAANAGLFYLLARRLLAAGFDHLRGPGNGPRTMPDLARGDTGPVLHHLRGPGNGPRTPPLADNPSGLEINSSVGWGAVVAALVFGLHPLRVESVAWVTERRDVLCGLFYLLAVLAYLRGTAAEEALRGRWRAASLAAFAAALGSKGMAMTLPLTLLVLDTYPLRRWHLGWRTVVREKVPYAVLAAAGAMTALWAVTRGAAWTPYDAYGLGARLAITGYGLWFYPRKLVWPDGLSPLYELPARVDPLDWRFLGSAMAVAGVTIVLVLLRWRAAGALAAWAHSAIVLGPVSGLAHAGYQLAHDRYSYLSGLGFALLAGAGATWLGREREQVSRWVFAAASGAVAVALLALAAESWQQSRIWRDSESLWRAAVEADPACALCVAKLGHALMERGQLGEAEAHLRRAVALRPERSGARNSLGTLLAQQGRHAEAEAEFHEALRVAPRLADAAANLGALYAREGKNAEAIALLRQALARAPWLQHARTNLAHALKNSGTRLARDSKPAEAAAFFREAARLLPEDADIWRNLGQALVEQGELAEAISALERAVGLRPAGAPERFWLARAYSLAGRPDEAEREIEALRELDPAAAAQLLPATSVARPAPPSSARARPSR